MTSKVTWNGRKVEGLIRRSMVSRMGQTMQLLVRETKIALNRGQPTATVGGRRVGLNPSKEGEAPKKVTGQLQNSIISRVDIEGRSVVGRFGSKLKSARRLELGFMGTDSAGRRIEQKPRPFLRPALADNIARIKRILGVS